VLKRSLVLGVAVLGAWIAPGSVFAAPLTCPTDDGLGTYNRFYTVDPALACVFGGGEINNNNPGKDDFLSGPLTTAPNDGIWGGINTALILNGETSGAAAGWQAIDYDFGSDPGPSGGDITIPNFDPTKEYLIGIKDGNQSPGWAVFLVNQATVNWKVLDPGGGSAFSHGVLYVRNGGGGGNGGAAPEPATLLLFGLAAAGGAYRARRRLSA
jgi:hypothetical protein